MIAACIKETASQLGNTPAVCRSSYIHPAVLDQFTDGRLKDDFRPRPGDGEKALLKFLDKLAGAADAKAA
jgi:DNA topoisomerase-1